MVNKNVIIPGNMDGMDRRCTQKYNRDIIFLCVVNVTIHATFETLQKIYLYWMSYTINRTMFVLLVKKHDGINK